MGKAAVGGVLRVTFSVFFFFCCLLAVLKPVRLAVADELAWEGVAAGVFFMCIFLVKTACGWELVARRGRVMWWRFDRWWGGGGVWD